jgi:hypothetical protein
MAYLTLSGPVNCGGGASGNGLLSLEDVDSVLEADSQMMAINRVGAGSTAAGIFGIPSGLRKTIYGYPLPKCYDKSVCSIDCSTIVPGCKKKEEFMALTPTSDAEDQRVYTSVCVERIYENPNYSKFFLTGLLPAIKEVYPGFKSSLIPAFTHYQEFTDKIKESQVIIGSGKVDAIVALIQLAKLYRGFVKVCQTNAGWAEKLDKKIEQFLNEPISGEAKSNVEVRAKCKESEAKYLATVAHVSGGGIFGIIKNIARTINRNQYLKAKQVLKNAFITQVKHSSPPTCECRGFDQHYSYTTNWNKNIAGKTINFFFFKLVMPRLSTDHYLNNIYPPRKTAVQNHCKNVCRK